jgi:hypothetical protein
MGASRAGALLVVALGAVAAGCAADRPGAMPGSLGRGPTPDTVQSVNPAASPAFVYYSPEQRRGRFRTMAEDNLGNLDAARPLAPRMIEVDLIVAQQVMDASTDTARKKEIRNDVVGWLIQASDERCGLYLETLNETDRETSVFFTGLATILGGLGAIFTPASTVRALSGAAGISAGVGSSWSNSAFLAQSQQAIAKAIRLRRATIRDEVRNRFGDEVSAWPLSSAASDVQRYHDSCSLPGAFAEITDALQRPSVTVRTPLDIIREQTREAAALRFQRECVAAANADPTSTRCKALKAEANGTGGS